jgi:3D (Asp-Asp-Asp) domain-containing protein
MLEEGEPTLSRQKAHVELLTVVLGLVVLLLTYVVYDQHLTIAELEAKSEDLRGAVLTAQQKVADSHKVTNLYRVGFNNRTNQLMDAEQRLAERTSELETLKLVNASLKPQQQPWFKPTLSKVEYKREFVATITAYNTVKGQCPAPYDQTASGKKAKKDMVAVSHDLLKSGIVKFGDTLHIEGVGRFTVEDTTAAGYSKRVDICMEKDIPAAKEFGVKRLKVSVVSSL